MLLEKKVISSHLTLEATWHSLIMAFIHNLRRFVLSMLLVVGVVTLVACQSTDFKAILTPPPCWQGICPDVTTKAEAMTQLSTLEFVEAVWDDYKGQTRWNFAKGTGFISYDQDGVVESIMIRFISSQPTVDQLQAWLGVSSGAIAFVGCDGFGDTQKVLIVMLFNPDTYITMTRDWVPESYRDRPGDSHEVTISGSQEMSVITYHSPDSYADIIEELSAQIDTPEVLPSEFQDGKTQLFMQKACN